MPVGAPLVSWFAGKRKAEKESLHPAQGYPRSGLAAAATTAFHAGVAAILGLYALFWLRLRLTDTLPVLAALVTVTGAAGYMALTARAAARRKLA